MASSRKKKSSKKRVIALTGVHTFLGARMVLELGSDPTVSEIVVFDRHPPRLASEKTTFHETDLTAPGVVDKIADALADVSAVVHAAFRSDPSHDEDGAHELETIGTLHLLDALSASKCNKLILCSTAMCYGAGPFNPSYLTESRTLARDPAGRFIADKIEAERQVQAFAQSHADRVVIILRPATVIGPTVQSYATRYLARRIATTIMGHDPVVQFLHEDDLVAACKLALDHDKPGAFNLAGEGVVALSRVFKLAGALNVPVPYFAAKSVMQLAWAAHLVEAPPAFLDYVKDVWVTDTRRVKDELGFAPQFSSKDALVDFLQTVKVRRIRNHDLGVA